MIRQRGGSLEIAIHADEDVILARQKVRELSGKLGFSSLDQTRIVTAVSELARNIVIHAGKGKVFILEANTEGRHGVTVRFEDQGPGIQDLDKSLSEGFSTVGSLGLGLSGAKRLVDDFRIESKPGRGTVVEISKWL